MTTRAAPDAGPRVPWYRVPVAWLGLAIFAASLAGCVWILVASIHFQDPALATPAHPVLGLPIHAAPAPPRS